jgi:hypothetical protein
VLGQKDGKAKEAKLLEEDGSVDMSLVENINKRKKAGKSRSKKDSTISKEAYADMQAGWPKKMSGGVVPKAKIARGCGAVMPDRRKKTKYF